MFYFIYDWPAIFFLSLSYSLIINDLFKSILKTFVFGLFISTISCVWGLTTKGGSKGVGLSTTSSVVICLICVFTLNFLLSYFMFDNLVSSFEFL